MPEDFQIRRAGPRDIPVLLDLMRTHVRRGGIVVAATHLPLGLDEARELKLERAA